MFSQNENINILAVIWQLLSVHIPKWNRIRAATNIIIIFG